MAPLREMTEETILEFISESVRSSNASGAVLGLSGGIDSAVVSLLCAKALGPDKVLNLFMPSPATPPQDRKDVAELCQGFGTELKVVDITPLLAPLAEMLPGERDHVLLGNAMARLRMIVLFHHAKLRGRVVMGTSNKSELLVGYFTKFGDGGADFCPIGDLYKTEVRELAVRLGVPAPIINKAPSACLWEGQTDEAEMGICYDDLDQVLVGLELNMSNQEIAKRTGIPLEKVDMVWRMHRASVHKRKMPLIPKVGLRTVGLDWRE